MKITTEDILGKSKPDFQFFTKDLEVKSTKDDKRIVIGYATTNDVDREYEVITAEAIEMAAQDLINSPTVFYEHRHSDFPVGKVIDARVKNGKMMVEVEISKTAERVWTLLQEGILRSFSIGGRFLETKQVMDKELGRELTNITKMELFEVSIVGLPANPAALITSVSKAISKSLDDKARGDGQGQGGARQGDGGASICVCPECGEEIAHVKGTPCNKIKCPECGAIMIGKNIKEDNLEEDDMGRKKKPAKEELEIEVEEKEEIKEEVIEKEEEVKEELKEEEIKEEKEEVKETKEEEVKEEKKEEEIEEKSFEEKVIESFKAIVDGLAEIKSLVTTEVKSTEVEEKEEVKEEEKKEEKKEDKIVTKRKGTVEEKEESTEDEKMLEKIKSMSLEDIMNTPEVWNSLDKDMQQSVKNEFFKNRI